MKILFVIFLLISLVVAKQVDDVDDHGGIYDQYDDEENWYIHDPLGERTMEKKKKEYIHDPLDERSNEKSIHGEDRTKLLEELESCKSSLAIQNTCQASLKTTQEDLVTCKIESKASIVSDTTYFKHFIRIFKDISRPVDEYSIGVQVKFSKSNSKGLESLLAESDDKNMKKILDIMKESFQPITVPVWDQAKEQILSWPVLIGATGFNMIMLLIFLCRKQIVLSNNWRWNIGAVLFFCLLCSIPLEWFRMYKEKLAEKTANTIDMPAECKPGELTPWSSMKLWMRDTFSLADNPCVQYHKDILVDPIFEVSPLRAVSASISIFFFEPMKHFFSAVGMSFRLLMKEIPVQWAPFVFIAVISIIIIAIMTYSGLEIYTPLLRIGFRNNQREVEHLQLRNQELENRLAIQQEELNRHPLQNRPQQLGHAELEQIGYGIEPLELRQGAPIAPRDWVQHAIQDRNRDSLDAVDDADDVIESLGSLTINSTQNRSPRNDTAQPSGYGTFTSDPATGNNSSLAVTMNAVTEDQSSINHSRLPLGPERSANNTVVGSSTLTSNEVQDHALNTSHELDVSENDNDAVYETSYNGGSSIPTEHDEQLLEATNNSILSSPNNNIQTRHLNEPEPIEHSLHSLDINPPRAESLGANNEYGVQESSDIMSTDMSDVTGVDTIATITHELDSEYEFVYRE